MPSACFRPRPVADAAGRREETHYVKVYVRKGSTDDERRISFAWADKVDPIVCLEHGYAIDGNQACESVTGTPETAMPILLARAELRLIEFLRGLGYEVRFA